jgi:AcrR family transcriptional regulator
MARPRQISDAQILEAARACFLEHGHQVSTTVIADRLGVSQAALFKRFGTKDDLMVAALRPDPSSLDGLIARLDAGPDDRAVPLQLREVALTIRDRFAEFLPRMAVLKSAGLTPPPRREGAPKPIPPQRVHTALVGWLEQAHRRGVLRVPDPAAAAFALLGAIHMQCFMAYMVGADGGLVSDEALASLVDSLWAGLAPREVSS